MHLPQIAAGSVLFVALLVQTAAAQQGISGYWTGWWENENGSRDRDQLDVVEYPNGQIAGVWGKGYHIQGQRTGPATYFWESHSEGSLYRARAQLIEGGRGMFVRYDVHYFKRGRPQHYEGVSELWRSW
jgi:hypothetical protein